MTHTAWSGGLIGFDFALGAGAARLPALPGLSLTRL